MVGVDSGFVRQTLSTSVLDTGAERKCSYNSEGEREKVDTGWVSRVKSNGHNVGAQRCLLGAGLGGTSRQVRSLGPRRTQE